MASKDFIEQASDAFLADDNHLLASMHFEGYQWKSRLSQNALERILIIMHADLLSIPRNKIQVALNLFLNFLNFVNYQLLQLINID